MVATDANETFFVDRRGTPLAVSGYFSRITALRSFRQAVETFGLKVSGLPEVDSQEVETVLKSLNQLHNFSWEELGELLTALKDIRENLDSFLTKPGSSFDPVSGGILFKASQGDSGDIAQYVYCPKPVGVFRFDGEQDVGFGMNGRGTVIRCRSTDPSAKNASYNPIFEILGDFKDGIPTGNFKVIYPSLGAEQMKLLLKNLDPSKQYEFLNPPSFTLTCDLKLVKHQSIESKLIAQGSIDWKLNRTSCKSKGRFCLDLIDGRISPTTPFNNVTTTLTVEGELSIGQCIVTDAFP
jgi:hypothetical protein